MHITSQKRDYMHKKISLKSYVLKAKKIQKKMGFRPNKWHLCYKFHIKLDLAEEILEQF